MLLEYFSKYSVRHKILFLSQPYIHCQTNAFIHTNTHILLAYIFCHICIFWSYLINQMEEIAGIIERINRFENGKLFFLLKKMRDDEYKARMKTIKKKVWNIKPYVMSPYPTVVIVTTAHQKPSGMDLKWECGDPASAK